MSEGRVKINYHTVVPKYKDNCNYEPLKKKENRFSQRVSSLFSITENKIFLLKPCLVLKSGLSELRHCLSLIDLFQNLQSASFYC